NGQLGVDVTRYFAKSFEVIAYRDVELDITDEKKISAAFEKDRPDVVVNCAAITNVDGCEADPELAFAVNAKGAGVVARAAQSVGATLVHISTDYVFDGTASKPYTEADPVCPKSVYGRSKLEGELEVLKACEKFYILRTAWLYGHAGNNFVKTMLKIGAEKGEVGVVTDQVGNPTSSMELVRIIEAVLKSGRFGIYHATCEGVCSWNAFAREIFRLAKMEVSVRDITSEQLMRPASRPAYSVLSKEKLLENCGYRPAQWQAAIAEYFTVQE
ncbi:MAG: dTDP-4-dehydrorhamnose reductase, partial [Clostridia bacterium]|nr:dTDP-4-dehydrorhamnose reductase [Clostridia bacterium]